MKEKAGKLLVLYASQTGNALDVAARIGREAERRGGIAIVRSIHDYDAASLPHEDTVIFVVSTTGQGDNPDSFKIFWRYLLQTNLTPTWLKGMHYAVFGLGHSGYQKYYNFVAKKLDKRLSDLGATPVIERGLGDDLHPSGYECDVDPWISSLWKVLYQIKPEYLPKGPDFVTLDGKLIDQPKVQIIYHDADEVNSKYPTASGIEAEIERARELYPRKLSNVKNKPHCFMKMIKNQQLTGLKFGKDVRHLEFEFMSSEIEYEVGDVLEILPSQNPELVDSFIQRCELDSDSYITVHLKEMSDHLLDTHINSSQVPVKLKDFVLWTMDVASATPHRYFFEVMSFFATAQHEKERLEYFASPKGRDDLYQYNQKERKTVLEVLEDFPSVKMPFEWLVQLVRPLKTRSFSISAPQLSHPNQVHFPVSVVTSTSPLKRIRSGLATTWLAKLDPKQGISIPVWFRKGCLPAPPPSLPLILIGPGAGCAPFRGFIEERARQSLSGSTAPVIFFFGCRNEDNDFLYKDFWLSHARDGGLLSEEKGGGFYVAFSRDQPCKIYVQHKMKEQGKRVWDFLLGGAAIYVAGSSTKMPSDVKTAFEEIISKEGGVSRESAVRWIRDLEEAGKYHVESWL